MDGWCWAKKDGDFLPRDNLSATAFLQISSGLRGSLGADDYLIGHRAAALTPLGLVCQSPENRSDFELFFLIVLINACTS
jgi:hypothetical protein